MLESMGKGGCCMSFTCAQQSEFNPAGCEARLSPCRPDACPLAGTRQAGLGRAALDQAQLSHSCPLQGHLPQGCTQATASQPATASRQPQEVRHAGRQAGAGQQGRFTCFFLLRMLYSRSEEKMHVYCILFLSYKHSACTQLTRGELHLGSPVADPLECLLQAPPALVHQVPNDHAGGPAEAPYAGP